MNGAPPHEPVRAIVIAVVLVALFSFFVVYPGHDPKPNGLPVAVTDEFALGAERAGFDVRFVDGPAAGRALIEDREVYGVIAERGARVLVTTAASLAASEAIRGAATELAGRPPRVVDVRPLDRDDPRNTTINLTVLGVLVPSILGAMLLFVMAPTLDPRRRVGLLAVYAVAGGLVAMLIVRVLMGALPGSYLELATVTALGILALAAVSSFFMVALGPPGIGVSFIFFLMLANPGSGAATAPELLPDPWSWAGQLLPPGALATGLRNTAYFDGAQAAMWLSVLVVFAALGAVGVLLRRP